MRERYESFHQVRYTDDALEAAVYQSHRYIPDRFLPDKAIDVIDEAGARVKLRVRREQGNLADWNQISEWSRQPDAGFGIEERVMTTSWCRRRSRVTMSKK